MDNFQVFKAPPKSFIKEVGWDEVNERLKNSFDREHNGLAFTGFIKEELKIDPNDLKLKLEESGYRVIDLGDVIKVDLPDK